MKYSSLLFIAMAGMACGNAQAASSGSIANPIPGLRVTMHHASVSVLSSGLPLVSRDDGTSTENRSPRKPKKYKGNKKKNPYGKKKGRRH